MVADISNVSHSPDKINRFDGGFNSLLQSSLVPCFHFEGSSVTSVALALTPCFVCDPDPSAGDHYRGTDGLAPQCQLCTVGPTSLVLHLPGGRLGSQPVMCFFSTGPQPRQPLLKASAFFCGSRMNKR